MTTVDRRSRLGSFVLAGALAVVLVAGGLSGPARAAIPLPHEDPFYRYDGATPLAAVPPGTVLKTRSVTVGVPGTGAGVVPATQLLYRTQDERRRPSVTVTTVVNPTGPANGGLVGYLSFYDALGDICSPSYTLQGGDPGQANAQLAYAETGLVLALAAQGYAVTVPDFEGTDLHWVAGHESGWSRSTPSARPRAPRDDQRPEGRPLRLLRRLDRGGVGQRARAGVRAKLNLVGAAVGGLPVHLAHNLGYVNGSQTWSGVIPAVLVSLGRAFDIPVRKFTNATASR